MCVRHWERAAELGSCDHLYKLACIFESGTSGVPKEYDKAALYLLDITDDEEDEFYDKSLERLNSLYRST